MIRVSDTKKASKPRKSKAVSADEKAKANVEKMQAVQAAISPTIPAETGFTGGDEDHWLHFHTSPYAYPAFDDNDLYDVWQVSEIGGLERIAVATKTPLPDLQMGYEGEHIAFITPHINRELAEHFLSMLYRLAETLKDGRDIMKQPLVMRQSVMQALQS